MAVLKRLSTGSEHVLVAHHVVGRVSTCQLRVGDPQVSGLHAEISWDGDRWLLQDLGSRNGTFVDGTRLAAGERAAVRRGAQLAFGDPADGYEVIDVGPPHLVAIAADGRWVVAESNLMCLPSNDRPLLTVFENAGGRWVLESDETHRTVEDHETVVVEGTSWTLHLPKASDRTRDAQGQALPLSAIGLEFSVSRDQEHVAIQLQHEQSSAELEARAHGQLLLELARTRLADAANPELAEPEHGWVHREDLARRLAIDPPLLNLWVHRARQQLVKTGIRDAGDVIERRPSTLQLRIGVSRLTIHEA
ncbi:MAG: FHA domain-containing protein [Myxococcales bacterium]|nr:FHA domain-containing protein [Myxococcales bacterium]